MAHETLNTGEDLKQKIYGSFNRGIRSSVLARVAH